MSVGSRIKECRKNKFTQARLAEIVGVHEMTLRRWEQDERPPDSNNLQALASALETSVAFLMGETDTQTIGIIEDSDKIPPENIRRAGEMITLPVYDIRTCAGLGSSHLFEEAEIIAERTIERKLVGAISEERRPFITKVSGDSMSEAKIYDGDEIVINPVQEVYSGDVAMVCFGEEKDTAIKWIYFLPDGSIELRSATPGFPIYTFTREQLLSETAQLEIVGKVMAYTGVPKRG